MSTHTQIAPNKTAGKVLEAAGFQHVIVVAVPKSRRVRTADIGWEQASKRLGGLLGEPDVLGQALDAASINFGRAGLETGRSAEVGGGHSVGPTNLTNSLTVASAGGLNNSSGGSSVGNSLS